MKIGVAVAAALLLLGCTPPAATSASTASSAAITPPASFTVDLLAQNDANIQGCTRMLTRHGGGGEIFVEDGVDTGAIGFIRVNGALLNVDLVSNTSTEKGGARTFADKARTITIVETLVTGAAHEEADSVEESGTLAVTFGGATQTIQVEGGTAC